MEKSQSRKSDLLFYVLCAVLVMGMLGALGTLTARAVVAADEDATPTCCPVRPTPVPYTPQAPIPGSYPPPPTEEPVAYPLWYVQIESMPFTVYMPVMER